jgi:hypothetical protein
VLMFYQNGDNKISSSIDICLDLIEAVGATDDVKIAVLIDKRELNDTHLYYYEGTSRIEQDWPKESDMSDPETIIQFIDKARTDYPAHHYCFEITANKGSGWQGISYDIHSDGMMITMPELFDAFDEITDNGCMKLDVIMVQSCLCGNLEFRYQVRQFCDYFVGYPDCGLVGDIPFDKILEDVTGNPLMNAEEFSVCCINHFVPQQFGYIYQAFSSTDSMELDGLTVAIDELALWLIDHMDTYKDDIQSALDETRRYGLAFFIDYYLDLEDFLSHLSISDASFNTVKEHILAAIQDVVISCVALEGYPSCGFNFYFPDTRDDYNKALRYDHSLPSPYEETLFAQDTQWDEFLKTYHDLMDNSPPDVPAITGPNKGAPGVEHEYVFTASDSNDDEICFFIDWGDGSSEWTNLESSGEEITASHVWAEKGSYSIEAKSIDQFGEESEWGTYEVEMPKTRLTSPIFSWLVYRFPQLLPLLQMILKV